MAEVVWRLEALGDLDEVIAYIEQFDPAAAKRTEDRLRQLGDSLATFPNRGRPGPDGTRQMVTVRPYVLTYMVEDDAVRIVGIRHMARGAD